MVYNRSAQHVPVVELWKNTTRTTSSRKLIFSYSITFNGRQKPKGIVNVYTKSRWTQDQRNFLDFQTNSKFSSMRCYDGGWFAPSFKILTTDSRSSESINVRLYLEKKFCSWSTQTAIGPKSSISLAWVKTTAGIKGCKPSFFSRALTCFLFSQSGFNIVSLTSLPFIIHSSVF